MRTLLTNGDLAAETRRYASALLLRGHKPTTVVGVPRKGMVPATILANIFDSQLAYSALLGCDFGRHCGELPSGRRVEHTYGSSTAHRSHLMNGLVLVVDEAIHTGRDLMQHALWVGQQNWVKDYGREVIMGAIYMTAEGAEQRRAAGYLDDVSFHGSAFISTEKNLCEWDAWHHPETNRWMVDMDGVLCPDRNAEAIPDESPIYENWIESAPQLYRPTFPIGAICSWRDAKYEKVTAHWCNERRIVVEKGIIHANRATLPGYSIGNVARWKAHQYIEAHREWGCQLFVESNALIAAAMRCHLRDLLVVESGDKLQVWCIEDMTL